MDRHRRASVLATSFLCARYELIRANRLCITAHLPRAFAGRWHHRALALTRVILPYVGSFLHLRHSTVANDALFSDEGPDISERPLTVIASFPMDRDNEHKRTTYVASDLGRGTESYAIRHLDRVIYFEILFSFRGAAASRVVVTCERTPSRWWIRRDLNDLAMTSLSVQVTAALKRGNYDDVVEISVIIDIRLEKDDKKALVNRTIDKYLIFIKTNVYKLSCFNRCFSPPLSLSLNI